MLKATKAQPQIQFQRRERKELFVESFQQLPLDSHREIKELKRKIKNHLKEPLPNTVFDKAFSLVLFSFLFGERGQLFLDKYRPLTQKMNTKDLDCENFSQALLQIYKKNKKLRKIYSQTHTLRINSKSWFVKNNFFDENCFSEFYAKYGILLVGEDGAGKKTLLNCFARTHHFKIETVDFSQFSRMNDFIQKYEKGLNMRDVHIDISVWSVTQ